MLALADPIGEVLITTRGLAAQARVSVEAVERAILKFQNPDPESRSQRAEGRRIVRLPDKGGWLLINYEQYRKTADKITQQEQARIRQARHRGLVAEAAGKKVPKRGRPISGEAAANRASAAGATDEQVDRIAEESLPCTHEKFDESRRCLACGKEVQ